MPDMNAELYRCCGYTVEISGHQVEMPGGHRGHRVHCELCGQEFVVPGEIQTARDAVPAHFLAMHQLKGSVNDWLP
jgi:hypothetical protein